MKIMKHRHSDSGVALLFALSILSVILVIAMIFSSNALMERRVASAMEKQSEAKSIAISAFNHVVVSMLKHNEITSRSYCADGDLNKNTYDYISKLKCANFEFGGSGGSYNTNSLPTWEYIKNANGNIAGRYAYFSSGSSIRMNPLAAGYKQSSGGSVAEPADAVTKRYGVSTTELKFDHEALSLGGTAFTAEWVRNNFDTIKTCNDNESLIKKFGKTETVSDNQYFCMIFNTKELPPAIPDYMDRDAFWKNDSSAAGTNIRDIDEAELQDRFNLNRTDWNIATVDTVKNAVPWLKYDGGDAAIAAACNQTVANLINYNAADTVDCISDVPPANWFSSTPNYTGNKRTAYLNEIGAEIKIYGSSGDKTQTIDTSDPSNPKTIVTWKLYYNVEVYLNTELIKMYKTLSPEGGYTSKIAGTISLDVAKYTNAVAADSSPSEIVSQSRDFSTESGVGPVDCTKPYTVSAFTTTPSVPSASSPSTPTFSLKIEGGTFQKIYGGSSGGWGETIPSGFDVIFKIRNIQIQIDKAMLTVGEKNVDFAVFGDKGKYKWEPGTLASVNTDATPAGHYYFSLQAKDPRQNLTEDCWLRFANTSSNGTNSGDLSGNIDNLSNMGGVNHDLCLAGMKLKDGTVDVETVTDPAWVDDANHLSTAYIRHGSMKSLWELGAIHRGKAWQTLNFWKSKKYDNSSAVLDMSTIHFGAYAEGDAPLLDQMTINYNDPVTISEVPHLVGYGKLNINTNGFSMANTATGIVFQSLFRGMIPSSSGERYNLDAITLSGTAVDHDALATALLNVAKKGRLYHRFEILGDEKTQEVITKAGDNGVPDADKEQVIGRFIGLTTTKAEPVSGAWFVIVAQSITELPVNALVSKASANNSLKDAYYYVSGGTKKKFANYTDYSDDMVKKDTKGTYKVGVDKITGEVKLYGEIVYDESTKKWKLSRVEYVE